MAELVDLRLPKGAVLSHTSAALLWELPLPHNHDDVAHVTVPRSRSRWTTTAAVVHRRSLSSSDVTVVCGARVTTVARTLLDLTTCLPMADAVAAADQALHRGLVTTGALQDRACQVRGPGSMNARRLVALADGSAGSQMESLLRVAMFVAGLPVPETQLAIHGPDGTFWVDFAWPDYRLVVEADGFAFHSDRESYRKDRTRGNELQRLGWRLLRFTWEQIVGRPQWVVAQIRAALCTQ